MKRRSMDPEMFEATCAGLLALFIFLLYLLTPTA